MNCNYARYVVHLPVIVAAVTSLWRQRADDDGPGPSPPVTVGTLVANAELVQLSFSTLKNLVGVCEWHIENKRADTVRAYYIQGTAK